VTKSKRTSPESGNGKPVLSPAAEFAMKNRSNPRPRIATLSPQRANEVRLAARSLHDERGVRRPPGGSALLSAGVHSSSAAHGLNRCVRLTHVAAACSVCGGFCQVAHLTGDKRARCAYCCPVCKLP
jgi:hypothetical protein